MSKLTADVSIDGLKQFEDDPELAKMFTELTNRHYIDTEQDVVSMVITYDSTQCLAITSFEDSHKSHF